MKKAENIINYKKSYAVIIEKLQSYLIDFYRERLVSVVVFGSVGRDKFHPESDIDILIILTDVPKNRSDRFFEYYNNVYLRLERDILQLIKKGICVSISPVIKTREETEYGSPIFIEMTEECKILFDKENFFESILNNIRKKMAEYGSKKIPFKGKYYWLLKPDYKWGDEIKL